MEIDKVLAPNDIPPYSRVVARRRMTFGDNFEVEPGTEGVVVQIFATFAGGILAFGEGVHSVGVLWDGDRPHSVRHIDVRELEVLGE